MHIPVLGMQIRRAVHKGTKLIVVDPRDIDLAHAADVHLKLTPGTNVAFANGMMNIILSEGLEDRKFIDERTENFEEMKKVIEKYPAEKVAEICHVDVDKLIEAAKMYASAKMQPLSTVWVLQSIIPVQRALCLSPIWQ